MNAKHLILAGVVTVGASAAAPAINYGHPEPVNAVKAETTAIPRVVVTAKRLEAPVARVVVTAKHAPAGATVAALAK